jgi:hypothetical protein
VKPRGVSTAGAVATALLCTMVAGCLKAPPAPQGDGPLAADARVDAPSTLLRLTLAPDADAYVEDGVEAGTNFGTADRLVVKLDDNAGYHRRAYLRFDLRDLPAGTIESAVLVLQILTINGPSDQELARAPDDWSEESLTWANQPASADVIVSHGVSAPGPTTIDLTSAVADERAGDGRLSLRIRSLTLASDVVDTYLHYASKESETPPQLEIAVRPP